LASLLLWFKDIFTWHDYNVQSACNGLNDAAFNQEQQYKNESFPFKSNSKQ
jgi:hypothetical protein